MVFLFYFLIEVKKWDEKGASGRAVAKVKQLKSHPVISNLCPIDGKNRGFWSWKGGVVAPPPPSPPPSICWLVGVKNCGPISTNGEGDKAFDILIPQG